MRVAVFQMAEVALSRRLLGDIFEAQAGEFLRQEPSKSLVIRQGRCVLRRGSEGEHSPKIERI
jgi:hypothetical protein